MFRACNMFRGGGSSVHRDPAWGPEGSDQTTEHGLVATEAPALAHQTPNCSPRLHCPLWVRRSEIFINSSEDKTFKECPAKINSCCILVTFFLFILQILTSSFGAIISVAVLQGDLICFKLPSLSIYIVVFFFFFFFF